MESRRLDKVTVENFAKTHPGSIVTDLLMHFDVDVVTNLISLYSGRQIYIPTAKTVWVGHRNEIIKEELNKSNTREVRMQLAIRFGLTTKDISDIYTVVRNKKVVVKSRTVKHIVDIIFRKHERWYRKEVWKLVKSSENVHFQDPETLYILKELRGNVMDRCIRDISTHLSLVGNERKKKDAVTILYKKIQEMW